MLLLIALLILLWAIFGGIFVHPLIWLFLILALLVFAADRSRL